MNGFAYPSMHADGEPDETGSPHEAHEQRGAILGGEAVRPRGTPKRLTRAGRRAGEHTSQGLGGVAGSSPQGQEAAVHRTVATRIDRFTAGQLSR